MTSHALPRPDPFADAGPLPARVLFAIFAAAFAVRCGNLLSIGDLRAYALSEDAWLFWNGARDWLDTGRFVYSTGDGYATQTERVPLYFLFLMPFRWLFGDTVWPPLVAQCLVDAGSCVVIARLGAMVGRAVGVVAGALAALWPNFVIHSGVILGDALFGFLFVLCLLFSARFLRDGRVRDAAAAGLICGLAIMTRPSVQFLPLAMAAAAPFVVRRHGGAWRNAIASAVLVVVGAAAPATPLVARNIALFDSAALTTQAGTFSYFWVVASVRAVRDGRPFGELTAELHREFDAEMARRNIDADRLDPFERARLHVERAMHELRKAPAVDIAAAWLRGAAVNIAAPALAVDRRVRALNTRSFYGSPGTGLFEKAWNFLTGNDPRYVFWMGLGMAGGAVALLLQGAGWALLLRRSVWAAAFAALAVAYFLLLTGPIMGPKYRLPFESILIVCQALAMVAIYARFRR